MKPHEQIDTEEYLRLLQLLKINDKSIEIMDPKSAFQGDNNLLESLIKNSEGRLKARVQITNFETGDSNWRELNLIELANLHLIDGFSGYEISFGAFGDKVKYTDMLRGSQKIPGFDLEDEVLFKSGVKISKKDMSSRNYEYTFASLPLISKNLSKGMEDIVIIKDKKFDESSSFIECSLCQILDVQKPRYLHIPGLFNNKQQYFNRAVKNLQIKNLLEIQGVETQALLSYVASLGFSEEKTEKEIPRNVKLQNNFVSIKEKSKKFDVMQIRVDNCQHNMQDLGFMNKIAMRNRIRILNNDLEEVSEENKATFEEKRKRQLQHFSKIFENFLEKSCFEFLRFNLNCEFKKIVTRVCWDIQYYNRISDLNGIEVDKEEERHAQISNFSKPDLRLFMEFFEEFEERFQILEFTEENIMEFVGEFAYRKALVDTINIVKGLKYMVIGKNINLLNFGIICEILGKREVFRRIGGFLGQSGQIEIETQKQYLKFLTSS